MTLRSIGNTGNQVLNPDGGIVITEQGGLLVGGLNVPVLSADGTVLVSGGGTAFFPDPVRGVKAPAAVFGDPIVSGDYNSVSGAPTLTLMTGPNGKPALRIVTGVGVNAEINFPNIAGSSFDGEVYALVSGAYAENVSSISFYATPDADYSTNFTVSSYNPLAAPVNSGVEPGGEYVVRLDRANRSVTGTITYPFVLTTHKLRITPVGGQSATVFIYGLGFAAQPARGRIAVICDDGYDSWFKLGQPIMQSRGIPMTCAVIPVNSDTGNGSFYLRQLQGFVQAGNAVVAHGPNKAGGVGNLLSAYSNTADRVADMVATRRWIADNGLAVKGYEACYVWPQGTWQSALTDVSLLDAALAAGFTTGRAANGRSAGLYGNFDALSKYQHLTMPIIGHTWAGNTAAEATNIAAIVASIDAAAAQGSDVILMLHRVQATTTADGSMSSIGIRVSDLTTLAAAIAAKVTAGTLQAVTLPQMALTRSGNFWQK